MSAALQSQTTRLRDSAAAAVTEQRGIAGHRRLECSASSKRLINAFLHQVISEINDINHGRHPALCD